MRLEGIFELEIIQPDGQRLFRRRKNLITSIGKTAMGSLITGLSNYSPMTHLVFGSDPTTPAYADVALGGESWAIDCQPAGGRITELSDSLAGFSVTLLKTAAQTYGGVSFQLCEMGVAGRAAGKVAVLFSRSTDVSPVTIAAGTTMIPTWTLRFAEEEQA